MHTIFRPLILALLLSLAYSAQAIETAIPVKLREAIPVDVSEVAAENLASPLPVDWYKRGTFMEIYVRSFKDSDADGIGDLKGLTQKLPYLKKLGITGIWLMPVMQSYDKDHGYSTQDYRAIEQDYGSMADFEALLKAAHAQGIGVIMDYLINHSAASNPLFINASASKQSAYHDWYVWQDEKDENWSIYGKNPWHKTKIGYYFAGFWGKMPDFNLRNPEVLRYHHNNLRFWLNKGVDGFRFDAVGNLVENGAQAWEMQPENYAIMQDIQKLVYSYQNRYIVCEVPADPIGFAEPCGSSFAFGHQNNLIQAAKGNKGKISAVARYFKKAPTQMATFLSNHDNFAGERIFDQLDGDLATYKLAAATYLTQPGIPFLYYGEEIGIAAGEGLYGDPALRVPMSWTDSAAGFSDNTPFRAVSSNIATHNVAMELKDPNSLYHFYATLLNLRKNHPALSIGNYTQIKTAENTLSFQRQNDDESLLVLLNYNKESHALSVENLPAGATLLPLYSNDSKPLKLEKTATQISITLPAQGVQIYQIK